MTIQGPRADISWLDEIQDWSKFDKQWIRDAEFRGVKDPYTQKLFYKLDSELHKQAETHRNLKKLAAKYLPEDPSKMEWAPAPEPNPLGEMSEADHAMVKAIHWAHWYGAAQQWKNTKL